ncbi:pilus assembly protein PilZ [Methylobacterium sp. J-030]|uniref:pilus assembly protein PilZ n=1 Tax=Methylobacterium sp. J-030 TaxID=2836627 RepID=UPI001FBA0690|nr:pilus assembly protein PilZ [Methylobacterium sp. J-030]MCJ2071299.1 pilus assembly protein PilZ [Methylobacterium sp. J-030]
MTDEKRLSGRTDCFSAGHIVIADSDRRLRCLVWNMSDTGALLEAGEEDAVPETFTLLTAIDQTFRRCMVVRRTGARFGVVFADA